MCSRSAVYNTKSTGPRTEPCGTPYFTVRAGDLILLNSTYCVRSDRYELNQSSAVPRMPNERDKRVIRICLSTVSNAADRSRNAISELSPLSRCMMTSEHTLARAVSVELCFLYAD